MSKVLLQVDICQGIAFASNYGDLNQTPHLLVSHCSRIVK